MFELQAPAFEETRRLTHTFIKLLPNKPRYLRFDAAVEHVGRGANRDGVEQTPQPQVSCTDLVTGETGHVVLTLALHRIIARAYPGETYVGKSFRITRNGRAREAGKQYVAFEVVEIQPKESNT